jgi:selenocysteine lyase/cysteine desulfurase
MISSLKLLYNTNMKYIRKFYPVLNNKVNGKKVIYLDSACSTLKNKLAIAEESDFLSKYGFCSGKRSVHYLSSLTEEKIQIARENISSQLNSSSQEIVFTSGTTESVNILANSIDFKKGDTVLISALEHNSVLLPFWRLAQKGLIKLDIVSIKDYKIDLKVLARKLESRPKLLCLTASSNIAGGIEPFTEAINLAHKRKCPVLIDAAQYIPSHKIDALNIDFLAFSGHKMGAPFGTGILYINKAHFPILSSAKLGGGTIKNISLKGKGIEVELLNSYMSFEAGIQNYAGIWSLYKNMEFLENLNYKNIRKHISDLVLYAKDELSRLPSIKVIGNNIEEGSLISFISQNKKFSNMDFQLYCNENPDYHFAFRSGKMCADLACLNLGLNGVIRISFYIYNTYEDIDIFIRILKNYIKSID